MTAGWTVVDKDRSLSAQRERMVVAKDCGDEIADGMAGDSGFHLSI